MTSPQAHYPLAQDIEQALQVAVGQANSNVFTDVRQKKDKETTGGGKKRKRTQDKTSLATGSGALTANVSWESPATIDGQPVVNKRRKKKDKTQGPLDVAPHPPTFTQAHNNPQIDPALQGIRSSLPTTELAAALKRAATGDPSLSAGPPLHDILGAAGDGEELLRVLSELDLPKIAGVLRSYTGEMGDGMFSGLNVPLPSLGGPSNPKRMHTNAAKNANGPGMPRRTAMKGSTSAMTPMGAADQQHLLSSRWINATKLGQMAREDGLIYKKGKFSAIEDELLTSAIESYCLSHRQSHEDILQVIKREAGGSRDTSDSNFWFEITAQVPLRPVIAVYHHVRRLYDAKARQGKWTQQEDEVLENSVINLGQQWEKIGQLVGRTASDCRDRWRNHLQHKDTRNVGPWTAEEEKQLTDIVYSMTVGIGRSADNDVFWNHVSQRMDYKRTRQQCRIKWYDGLNKTVKNKGDKPRWSSQDAYILVYKVGSLDVSDDTEIDWKALNDDDWNLWSPHQLQRRWQVLKKAVKGYETMSFKEIVEILKAKKGQAPPQVIKKWGGKRFNISAAFVTDEDVADDVPPVDGFMSMMQDLEDSDEAPA